METDRLRYFCTIAEIGSLTKAADILGLSHSGLSKAMTALQSELSLELFRPHGRGLELTAAGKAIYEPCREIIQKTEALIAARGPTPALAARIAMTEIFALTLAGEFAKALGPNVDFFEHDTGALEVEILESRIDFAISLLPFSHPELEYLKIKTVGLGVFSANPKFNTKKLSEIPFIIPNTELRQNPLSIKSRDGWPNPLPRKPAYGASTLAMALSIVESGVAAVLMPKFVAQILNTNREKHNQLLLYPGPEKELRSLTREVFLVKRKNIDESRPMKICAKIIRSKC